MRVGRACDQKPRPRSSTCSASEMRLNPSRSSSSVMISGGAECITCARTCQRDRDSCRHMRGLSATRRGAVHYRRADEAVDALLNERLLKGRDGGVHRAGDWLNVGAVRALQVQAPKEADGAAAPHRRVGIDKLLRRQIVQVHSVGTARVGRAAGIGSCVHSIMAGSTDFTWPTMSSLTRCLMHSYAHDMATGCAWNVEPQPSGFVRKCSWEIAPRSRRDRAGM